MYEKKAPQPMQSQSSPWTDMFQSSGDNTTDKPMSEDKQANQSQPYAEQQPTHDALSEVYNRFENNEQTIQ